MVADDRAELAGRHLVVLGKLVDDVVVDKPPVVRYDGAVAAGIPVVADDRTVLRSLVDNPVAAGACSGRC